MTHEQFIYWLEGYLAGSTVPHDHKVAITAKIAEARARPAPVGIGIRGPFVPGHTITGGVADAHGQPGTMLFGAHVGNSTINCGAQIDPAR